MSAESHQVKTPERIRIIDHSNLAEPCLKGCDILISPANVIAKQEEL
jgi:hypothetical protein